MSSPSRRTLLKTFAGAGAAAAFGRLFESDPAYGAEGAPLRFLALFTPHGLLPEYWRPRNGELDFDIDFENATLRPLAPFRDKLLILDGLDYKVLYEYGKSGHEGAPVTFLTGSRIVGDELPENQSLDQFLAERIGATTKFRSLEVAAFQQYEGPHVYNTLSFSKAGSRVPFERDPGKVYSRLFGNLVNTGGDPAAQAALARKKSLLDFVRKDVSRLRDRLNGAEREKLEHHLAVVRSIEARLSNLTGCAKPARPSVPAVGNIANAPQLFRLHLDLIAQAFACDLTRVATLFGQCEAPGMPWLSLNMSIHDDIAHRVGPGSSAAQLEVNLRMVKVQEWYAEQVAYLLARLAEIPEGSGSVLDNTLILWGNELGDAAGHGNTQVPTVLAGGAGGKLRMGRYLRLRTADPLAGWDGFGDKAPNATAHNQLLVTIAQAFGQDVQTFGQPDYQGPIAGLLT